MSKAIYRLWNVLKLISFEINGPVVKLALVERRWSDYVQTLWTVFVFIWYIIDAKSFPVKVEHIGFCSSADEISCDFFMIPELKKIL
jgi:hypothetical protein